MPTAEWRAPSSPREPAPAPRRGATVSNRVLCVISSSASDSADRFAISRFNQDRAAVARTSCEIPTAAAPENVADIFQVPAAAGSSDAPLTKVCFSVTDSSEGISRVPFDRE
ncbi:hypothetical protein EVAR_11719_1 [Eumeta japonica]|uniref:Uncharacterized protein n=1 Tax=Eumeta variegata TaxID=151549 RepID=A0A4C1U4L1_EUMVA|nr:hypothetical protein EVAR_11719_1 [Eumeta japonica]